MSKTPQIDQASLNIFDVIETMCADFRKQCKAGKRPKIEEYLAKVPKHASETLFRNLLPVDIRYRERGGEHPSAIDYSSRFPQFKRVIGDAFHYSTSPSSDGSIGTPIDRLDAMPETVGTPAANRIGDYELIRELGRGGFGVVYEARHIKRGNQVALKTLPTGSDGQEINAERLHSFRKEFRSLSEINHPNLVGMQTLEVDGSQWFFTMDLIEGGDFLSFVRPGGKLDESRLRESLKQLVSGIIALHDQQVLHRDLKPSNVMVGADGRVLILDFGLIAELEQQTDHTVSAHSRQFAGTPRYAAPEQAFGQRSPATDWYAFGTMLYEALTGEAPFLGTHAELLIRKQNEDAPRLANQDGLPEDLASLTDSLLQRDPVQRPHAEAIASALSVKFDSATHSSSDSQVDGTESDLNSDEMKTILIGRERQLEQLASAKAELQERRTPLVVWLTGLSGEGKSTLVESFLRPIRRHKELLVLSGRCYDRELVPFKVIDSQIDSLVRFLRGLPKAKVEKILPQDIEKLARLFPILRRVDSINDRCRKPAERVEESQLHNLAFAALKDLLRSIGKSTPIVMFVDDLQWGDRDSADVLYKLLDQPDPPGILLLGTFRSDEMDESPFLLQWNEASALRERPISMRQISVEALTKEECISFLQRRFEDAYESIESVVDELYFNCKGNPYLLEQLVEGFEPETGMIHPRSLTEIVQSRLARCPEGASELLDAIAVAGKAVLPLEASEVAGCSSSGLATLTHMRSERLVRLVDSQQEQLVDTYHDKIRENALHSLGDERRKQLHRTYGETIETLAAEQEIQSAPANAIHSRALDLANHFEQAGDPRAFKYLMQAGQAALETYAMDAAANYLRRADDLRPDILDRETEYSLRMMLARALLGSNDVDSCIRHCDRAAGLATSATNEAEAWYLLAEARWRLGEYQEALLVMRRAFSAVGERVPRTAVGNIVKANLALMRFHLSPLELPLNAAESRRGAALAVEMYGKFSHMTVQFDPFSYMFACSRACVLARKLKDPAAKAIAYGTYAHFLGVSGIAWLSGRMVSAAQRCAQNLSTDKVAFAKYHDGCQLYCRGRLDDALQLLGEADALFARSGDWQLSLAVHFQRHCWSVKGNAVEILRHAQREVEIARQTGDAIVTAWGLYGRADGLSRSGDLSAALRDADEAIQLLGDCGSETTLPIAYQERGRVELQASQYSQARKSLGHAIKMVLKLRIFEITVNVFPLYVEAVMGTDWRPDSGSSVSSKDVRYASRAALMGRLTGLVFPNNRPHSLRVTGRLQASRGRSSKAIKSLDKAIAVAKKIGAEYEHARALIDKSLLDHPDANADRQRGLQMLERLGCVLPDAELKYLGIDRDSHHARAAAVNETVDENC